MDKSVKTKFKSKKADKMSTNKMAKNNRYNRGRRKKGFRRRKLTLRLMIDLLY